MSCLISLLEYPNIVNIGSLYTSLGDFAGVFYALQKKYLKTILFCICESPKGPMIEEYSCQAFFLFYHEFFLAA